MIAEKQKSQCLLHETISHRESFRLQFPVGPPVSEFPAGPWVRLVAVLHPELAAGVRAS